MSTHPHTHDDDLDRPIWGAAAIGEVLDLSERQTYHLLQTKKLPAKKIGSRHVSTKRQLLSAFTVETAA